ncbi:uncharacterized protein CC84DRAFT_865681 [Paraphaeosphaeria sporulosa]|uniref:Uncharacterized protein n=1 Tax=Paraphaeosphaeria sporulosa TaxID=1460663 RepID=A0A177CAF7_9PLEO|nr:uncharacterized protein CC84DRAFT_865681 [Paraphaeosphaeria sporulosa]OAG03747.1 hypothetical protein CC84DRAFT_865681 [Paraphaeosphaeria sporulosa]
MSITLMFHDAICLELFGLYTHRLHILAVLGTSARVSALLQCTHSEGSGLASALLYLPFRYNSGAHALQCHVMYGTRAFVFRSREPCNRRTADGEEAGRRGYFRDTRCARNKRQSPNSPPHAMFCGMPWHGMAWCRSACPRACYPDLGCQPPVTSDVLDLIYLIYTHRIASHLTSRVCRRGRPPPAQHRPTHTKNHSQTTPNDSPFLDCDPRSARRPRAGARCPRMWGPLASSSDYESTGWMRIRESHAVRSEARRWTQDRRGGFRRRLDTGLRLGIVEMRARVWGQLGRRQLGADGRRAQDLGRMVLRAYGLRDPGWQGMGLHGMVDALCCEACRVTRACVRACVRRPWLSWHHGSGPWGSSLISGRPALHCVRCECFCHGRGVVGQQDRRDLWTATAVRSRRGDASLESLRPS